MKITKDKLEQMIKEEVRLIKEAYLSGDKTSGEEELERAMYGWVMKNNFFMSGEQMQEVVLRLLEKASDNLRAR
jgi:hypothetical protein